MGTAFDIYQEKMTKTLSVLKEDLNTVRAGRANAALLDQITVDYYGVPTPLKNMANIQVPDPRSLTIIPFDPKSLKNIEKAIQMSNLGINPTNDGKNVRLVIPPLTEDDLKDDLDEIQKATDKCMKDIDEIVSGKEKELMEI